MSSFQSLEKCGSFWLSVAATIALPTLLALSAVFYVHVSVIYTHHSGGKVETSTIFGVIDQKSIAPGSLDKPPSAGFSGACCSSSTGTRVDDFYRGTEHGVGSFALLVGGYPVRNFNWALNSENATNAGVQLMRKLTKRAILEEESIGWSQIILSSIGFVFGLVGLLRDPTTIPLAFKAMFIPSTVPDIRVFLLGSTLASLLGFLGGAVAGLASHAPSAKEAANKVHNVALWFLWSLLCMASFGIGCWQINTRRVAKETVWPMFIYWAPAAMSVQVSCCGINAFPVFAMVGVALAIVAENKIACHR